MPVLQEAVEATKEKHPCRDQRSRDESDLCAQWRAANAAKEAARWAWWQFIVSIAGVIGLGITLWFNFRALRLAEREAEETKGALAIAERNAETGRDQLKHSREASRIQLQPYVFVDRIYLEKGRDGKWKDLCVQIKNYGQTPAMYVNPTVGWSIAPYPIKRQPLRGGFNAPPIGSIAPNAPQVIRSRLPSIAEAALERIAAGKDAFVVFVAFSYESRFEGRQSWSGYYLSEGEDFPKGEFRQLTGHEAAGEQET